MQYTLNAPTPRTRSCVCLAFAERQCTHILLAVLVFTKMQQNKGNLEKCKEPRPPQCAPKPSRDILTTCTQESPHIDGPPPSTWGPPKLPLVKTGPAHWGQSILVGWSARIHVMPKPLKATSCPKATKRTPQNYRHRLPRLPLPTVPLPFLPQNYSASVGIFFSRFLVKQGGKGLQ